VSSGAHVRAALDFGDSQSERDYSAMGAYAVSKLANILFNACPGEKDLGHRGDGELLDPGVVNSRFFESVGAGCAMRLRLRGLRRGGCQDLDLLGVV